MRPVLLKSLSPLFLILLIVLCFLVQKDLAIKREHFLEKTYMDYTLPSKVSGIVAMEFKGIVSDFLFLKVSTFLGDKFMKRLMLGDRHAEYIYNSVDVITDLDPWFWDAYLLANMVLSWDFRKIDKANTLLFKAREYRTDDFQVPYQIGFNYYYFLKDNTNGAKYMMEASKLPGSPAYLTSLAARLFMYQNQYKPAILFLKDVIAKTRNPVLKKRFETRLNTLIVLDDLEKAVDKFKEIYGHFPLKISDLVEKKIIEKIPQDPYGGDFFIMKNSRVFTTSKMVFKKRKPSQEKQFDSSN